MAVHFLHVGKTGGTAIKHALESSGHAAKAGRVTVRPVLAHASRRAAREVAPTPFGPILLHRHRFRLRGVPPGDPAFFCLRDPITRFVSAFNSRKRKGQPRRLSEWSRAEQVAFGRFDSPLALAHALGSQVPSERRRAEAAMAAIEHVCDHYTRWLGDETLLRARRDQILFIGRQEHLSDDFEQLKRLLELPADLQLPDDPVAAHRAVGAPAAPLDDRAHRVLRDWYARDYEILDFCEQLRHDRGWSGAASPERPLG